MKQKRLYTIYTIQQEFLYNSYLYNNFHNSDFFVVITPYFIEVITPSI